MLYHYAYSVALCFIDKQTETVDVRHFVGTAYAHDLDELDRIALNNSYQYYPEDKWERDIDVTRIED